MRYSRQEILKEFGKTGQKKLKNAKIIVVGAGGLGSPALLYLTAAGVGNIHLIEDDLLDLSNLNRQILYKTESLNLNKSKLAKLELTKLNPDIQIIEHPTRLDTENAENLLKSFDIVIDCTDNLESKYLINDVCLKLNIPFVFASISKFEGRLAVFNYKNTFCFRCLYPKLPEAEIQNCSEAGILGAVAGILGSMQALEAIKIILGLEPLRKLLVLDCLNLKQIQIPIKKSKTCICNHSDTIIIKKSNSNISLDAFLNLKIKPVIIDIRESDELEVGIIPGAIHWPLSKIKKEIFSKEILQNTKNCILYCKSGIRSELALKILNENELYGARHLLGGYDSFRKAHAPATIRSRQTGKIPSSK